MAPTTEEPAVLTTAVSFREDTQEDWHEFEVVGGDEPKILVRKTSIHTERTGMHTEKQISVDPVSLRSSSLLSMMRNDSFDLIMPPAISPPRDLDVPLPLPLQPVKKKFVSCSLPSSAATSPKSSSSGQLKKSKNKELPQTLKERDLSLMVVQDAATAFRRSKSCGEGRACTPSLDFDMFLHKSKDRHSNDQNAKHRQTSFSSKSLSNKSSGSFFSKSNKSLKSMNSFEDGFKCSALCLYLPGFGKGKPVRSSRKDDFSRMMSSMTRNTSFKDTNTVISARASLEKFECGSWTSSALIYDDNADAGGHFFDLPSELIKGSGNSDNDKDEPVSAAFVFDKEPFEKEIKGVLKTSGSKSRRSTESSPRHVRFSTSSPVSYPASPSCMTPRLRQATEDFNAFLEAQTV